MLRTPTKHSMSFSMDVDRRIFFIQGTSTPCAEHANSKSFFAFCGISRRWLHCALGSRHFRRLIFRLIKLAHEKSKRDVLSTDVAESGTRSAPEATLTPDKLGHPNYRSPTGWYAYPLFAVYFSFFYLFVFFVLVCSQ